MKQKLKLAALLVLSGVVTAALADEIATMRQGVEITKEAEPAPIPRVNNENIRSKRSYPMQPPLIPHDTRDYELNLKVNKCMACHARRRTEESQAPMISVTHYMDRDGNFLAEVSPRRYFCDQCHVTQTMTRDVPENDFEDMDELLRKRAAANKDD